MTNASTTVPQIIETKRQKMEISGEHIQWFIEQMVKGNVQSCQLGAFLMAVNLNGMTVQETAALTKAMARSGDYLEWDKSHRSLLVDKHSTGGVGDKVNIILVPALAACGMMCPSISGKGLGITGGTIDKLDSIPGMRTAYSAKEITKITTSVGCCIVSQSATVNPADKVMYATRDVTSTVASVPLITSSILSKKFCEGLSTLIVDVKCGRSAFMKSREDAQELAERMKAVGDILEMRTIVAITQMDDPLGVMIGNSVEVIESVEIMKDKGHSDIVNLIAVLGSHLLLAASKASSEADGEKQIRDVLKNGKALSKFTEMIIAQQVPEDVAEQLKNGQYEQVFGKTKHCEEIKSHESGFVQSLDSAALAEIVMRMGGGRMKTDDELDYQVGIELLKHVGDPVEKGDPWCKLMYNHSPIDGFDFRAKLSGSLTLGDKSIKIQRVLAVL